MIRDSQTDAKLKLNHSVETDDDDVCYTNTVAIVGYQLCYVRIYVRIYARVCASKRGMNIRPASCNMITDIIALMTTKGKRSSLIGGFTCLRQDLF